MEDQVETLGDITSEVHAACTDMIEAFGAFRATGSPEYLVEMAESRERAGERITALGSLLEGFNPRGR
jgi:hypothetical protein